MQDSAATRKDFMRETFNRDLTEGNEENDGNHECTLMDTNFEVR